MIKDVDFMKEFLGAEARISIDDVVIKERIPKKYRHVLLDERLRRERNRLEIRILKRLYSQGVNVPKVLEEREYGFVMEYIKGETFYKIEDYNDKIIKKFAKEVAKMHNLDIVHGDLTLRNVVLSEGNVYLIDFGLSDYSKRYEDKSMDLYVLEETSKIKDFPLDLFLEFYFSYVRDGDKIEKQLERIRRRRRYLGGT